VGKRRALDPRMKAMLALLLIVILVGGAVGLSADHASADQPPNVTAWCGPAAVTQAEAAGMQLPAGAGTASMAICWYPAAESSL
jgi:hypothetical protein